MDLIFPVVFQCPTCLLFSSQRYLCLQQCCVLLFQALIQGMKWGLMSSQLLALILRPWHLGPLSCLLGLACNPRIGGCENTVVSGFEDSFKNTGASLLVRRLAQGQPRNPGEIRKMHQAG